MRARINALAYRPAALLVDELKLKGDPDAELAAQLVQGVVNAGVRLLHSQSIDDVEPLTVTLAQTLVRSRAAALMIDRGLRSRSCAARRRRRRGGRDVPAGLERSGCDAFVVAGLGATCSCSCCARRLFHATSAASGRD